MSDRWRRYSRAVTKSKRWRGLRLEALRRDAFKCVACGARGRLEVDHVQPVRARPDLAYALDNLQCLCPSCHARKTAGEIGFRLPTEQAKAWSMAIKALTGANRGSIDHAGIREDQPPTE